MSVSRAAFDAAALVTDPLMGPSPGMVMLDVLMACLDLGFTTGGIGESPAGSEGDELAIADPADVGSFGFKALTLPYGPDDIRAASRLMHPACGYSIRSQHAAAPGLLDVLTSAQANR
jgi:hypothetical protein